VIEANNENIDVNELMQRVREEVAKRKSSFPIQQDVTNSIKFSEETSNSFSRIQALLNNSELYSQVSSELPQKLNRFPFNIVIIKKVILKVYSFLFKKQRVVNSSLIQSLRETLQLNQQLLPRLDVVEQLLPRLDVVEMNKRLPISLQIHENSYLKQAIALSSISDKERQNSRKKDLFYHLFENIFYNSELVKEKQKIYLQYINRNLNGDFCFLDLGCGRGEFLKNLKDESINALGIDINELQVSNLLANNYNVICSDILEFLETNNHQYCGISSLQVVEHLNFEYIEQFLEVSFKKLVSGGVLILETVNPHSLYALSNFHQDPTHINPIPPERLCFCLEWYGFENVKVIYSSLLPEPYRIFRDARMNYQDYAVVGYKP